MENVRKKTQNPIESHLSVDFIQSLLVLPTDPFFYLDLKWSIYTWGKNTSIRVEAFGINEKPFSMHLRWIYSKKKFISGHMDNCRRF